jgi:hypothetical protein
MTDHDDHRAGGLREGAVITGLFWGILMGGVWALVRGPRLSVKEAISTSRERIVEASSDLRERVEAAAPRDPVSEGIAEGKAAARRRLAELGLSDAPPEQLPKG